MWFATDRLIFKSSAFLKRLVEFRTWQTSSTRGQGPDAADPPFA